MMTFIHCIDKVNVLIHLVYRLLPDSRIVPDWNILDNVCQKDTIPFFIYTYSETHNFFISLQIY